MADLIVFKNGVEGSRTVASLHEGRCPSSSRQGRDGSPRQRGNPSPLKPLRVLLPILSTAALYVQKACGVIWLFGVEGSRTPVRRVRSESHYERSQILFFFAPGLTPGGVFPELSPILFPLLASRKNKPGIRIYDALIRPYRMNREASYLIS